MINSPFPGMDPYLEHNGIWRQVHTSLMVDIQRFLQPMLRPKYHVSIEQHTYLALTPPSDDLVGIPDIVITTDSAPFGTVSVATASVTTPTIGTLPMTEEVLHRYLTVRDIETREAVTVMEVLSYANKRQPGRDQYLEKRQEILRSRTNLVEIDLLRAGKPLPMSGVKKSDYRIVVSRAYQRPNAAFYLFDLQEEIPNFPIPLRRNEDEPILRLNEIVHKLYDEGAYDMLIDYQKQPKPALSVENEAWRREIVAP